MDFGSDSLSPKVRDIKNLMGPTQLSETLSEELAWEDPEGLSQSSTLLVLDGSRRFWGIDGSQWF